MPDTRRQKLEVLAREVERYLKAWGVEMTADDLLARWLSREEIPDA